MRLLPRRDSEGKSAVFTEEWNPIRIPQLSNQEITAASRSEELRIRKELDATVHSLQEQEKKMNLLRDTYESFERQARERHQSLLAQLEHERGVMSAEIAELERKKHALMESLSMKRLIERENAAKTLEASLVSREGFYSAWKDELEKSQHENDNERKKILHRREKVVEQEAEADKRISQANLRSKQILEEERKLTKRVEIENTRIAQEILASQTRLAELSMSESALRELKEMLDREKEEIAKQQRHIWSQQQALRTAFDEARRKGLLS